MKNVNLIVIFAVTATFVFSIIALQTTKIEASYNSSATATPSPRKKRPKTIQSPKPIQSPITKTRTKKLGKKRGIPAPTPSPITKRIGVPAPTPSPEN